MKTNTAMLWLMPTATKWKQPSRLMILKVGKLKLTTGV